MTECAPVLGRPGYRIPRPRVHGPLQQRLARGEPTAWDEVTRRYGGLLRAVARSCGLTAEETEDAVQRVWLTLFEKADGIRSQEALTNWLTVTARRECWRVARQRLREVPADDVTAGDDPEVSRDEAEETTERILTGQRATALHAAIGKLPPRQRELTRLLLATDLSYAEIGERIGMPVGSVGPTRGRAMARLRTLLESSPAFAPAEP